MKTPITSEDSDQPKDWVAGCDHAEGDEESIAMIALAEALSMPGVLAFLALCVGILIFSVTVLVAGAMRS